MNFLRSAKTVGPFFKWSHRAGIMTTTPNCCTKFTTSWSGSRDEQRRSPSMLLSRKFMHTKDSSSLTNRDLTITPPCQPSYQPSINALIQLKDNAAPYARLMRMDRPIGK